MNPPVPGDRPAPPPLPEPGGAAEVAPGIWWVRLPMPWRLDHVNAYALDERPDGGRGWTLIDTGLDTPDTRAAWESALAGPLGGRPVERVIATHHHPDHLGLAGWFEARGAEFWTTRTAYLCARMLSLDELALPHPRTLAFWREAGMDPGVYAARAAARPFTFADVAHALPPGYRRVSEGDTIRAGGRDWRVRLGQGHAPDHATLWSADGAVVIAGDQILPRISPNLSVQAAEPAADPVGEWIASCEALAPLARPGTLGLPGHNAPFTGVAARLDQMAQAHRATLDRLEAALGEPRTAVQCFGTLFRRPVEEGEYLLALGEAVAHLNALLAQGRVSRQRPDGQDAWLWQRI